mgnify:FL=1|tara:strand:- start:1352 stop:2770 length:1419 start_codon:yes stop_codon:yes gene_type:complete
MSIIQTSLINFFKSYPNRPIVVAYSGGIDSKVLLHCLAKLQSQKIIVNELSACHVNHGISTSSLCWQQTAERFCQSISVPLKTFQVNVKDIKGESLEALARDARYKVLKKNATSDALIVTGHHLDDQSETFLLALKRGAGLKGLSAMSELSKLSLNGNFEGAKSGQLLVRPLLKVTREDIEHYAQAHDLTWVEDESNKDLRFDRNFLRHQVMPLLTKRWPSILTTIKRSSENCQQGQQLLTELAQQDLQVCQLSLSSLSVNKLLKLSLARFNNLLRYFLELNNCLMPSSKQLQQVHQQMLASDDKVPEIKVSGHWLRRYKGALFITPNYQILSSWQHQLSTSLSQSNTQLIELPDGLGCLSFIIKRHNKQHAIKDTLIQAHQLMLPTEDQVISIGFTHQNPKCLPDFRQRSRNLKKVLQELNIAPWQRKRIPFIFYDHILVAAVGYFVCKEYVAREGDFCIAISLDKTTSEY